jgi:DNA invertase Pin-like site-specific DNA recombinase
VAYIRASTEDQQLGPEAQRSAIEAWAGRTGVTVASWHIDQGISGGAPVEKRPALMAAIAALRECKAGILVAAKRDRLAREVEQSRRLEYMITRERAIIRTADGSSDHAGPAGKLMNTVQDSFAEYERIVIGVRTKEALAVKKSKGERVGEVSYGFQLAADGKHVETNPLEQAVIEQIIELKAEGRSEYGVARELMKAGVKSRAGTPLSRTQVRRILEKRYG